MALSGAFILVMMINSGFARTNGTRLYYEAAGAGSPAIVFIHGMSLDTRMWDDQFDRFAETHTVVRYDLRGFGKSDMPDGAPYSHHEDLRALLDHVGLEKAALVGLSLGGRVATDFALTYPERVEALLVLVGSDEVEDYLDIGQTLVSSIPNAEFHRIEGMAHETNMATTGQFNELLSEFLDRL